MDTQGKGVRRGGGGGTRKEKGRKGAMDMRRREKEKRSERL